MRTDFWPKGYVCLKSQCFSDGNYSILPIHLNNVEDIRKWRNDQINVLRQENPISSSTQQSYFQDRVLPNFFSFQPEQILFSLYYQNSLIGYGGLVHISWENFSGEMSFLVDKSRAQNPDIYSEDLSNFIKLIRKVASELGLSKITTETFAHRSFHIQILEKNGFYEILHQGEKSSIYHLIEVELND